MESEIKENQMDLLRFTTAGSVDDGKSTLIGRLLYDSKSIFEDQWDAVETSSKKRGDENVNLALLTDGLKAEREQGITIDVAYRYYATPRRKFIIADTPGHIQYHPEHGDRCIYCQPRHSPGGCRNGVVEQTCRHAFIATLLQIQHLVVCVNKMDLVDWSEEAYQKIESDFRKFASRLDVADIRFIPISALLGDNVVDASKNMPWYGGAPLLETLETVYIGDEHNHVDARFPVQWVVRPQSDDYHDFRGYAGRVASGVFKPGDEVTVLPSGFTSRIKKIHTYDGDLEEAFAPQSVQILLYDEIDISRGDMIVKPNNKPKVGQDIEAMICWFSESSTLRPGSRFLLRHTTKEVKAIVRESRYKVNVNTLHKIEGDPEFKLNEVGRILLRVAAPLFHDPYKNNRTTGSFILVDPNTNVTVAAGMIL